MDRTRSTLAPDRSLAKTTRAARPTRRPGTHGGRVRPLLTALFCLSVVGAALAQETIDPSVELQTMADADQEERRSGTLDPEKDVARLERVKQLLAAGSLRSGADYYNAALILQHSPDLSGRDHLVAHVLATVGALKGHEGSRWLAAAALDRFLTFNRMEQFFGTQFERDDDGLWRPGAYDRWRTEALRELYQIPDDESQRRRAESWNP